MPTDLHRQAHTKLGVWSQLEKAGYVVWAVLLETEP